MIVKGRSSIQNHSIHNATIKRNCGKAFDIHYGCNEIPLTTISTYIVINSYFRGSLTILASAHLFLC